LNLPKPLREMFVLIGSVCAFVGWGGLAYFMITELCCNASPLLFALVFACLAVSIYAAVLMLVERLISLDYLERTDKDAYLQALYDELQDLKTRHPWMFVQRGIVTNEYVTENHIRYLDLDLVSGRPGAAKKFQDEVKRQFTLFGEASLLVDEWKVFDGVGRIPFEKMRTELLDFDYVKQEANGKYTWTSKGEDWIRKL
jgi:hypothetical protein